MADITGKNVAMIIAKNFEDVEATDPKEYIEQHGGKVTLISMDMDNIEGKKGTVLKPDMTIDQAKVEKFDALVIPGGGSPEELRIHDGAVKFTRDFMESGKPVASICHGAQLLISAEVTNGRKLTCVAKIRDDVKNAGGNYVDEPVVIDGNLISSRVPKDMPQFNEAIVNSLATVTAD